MGNTIHAFWLQQLGSPQPPLKRGAIVRAPLFKGGWGDLSYLAIFCRAWQSAIALAAKPARGNKQPEKEMGLDAISSKLDLQ